MARRKSERGGHICKESGQFLSAQIELIFQITGYTASISDDSYTILFIRET